MLASYESRIAACVVASVVAHFTIAHFLNQLPEQPPMQQPVRVEMKVTDAPPPAPEPEPEPPKPEPKPEEKPEPRPLLTPPKVVQQPHVAPPPKVVIPRDAVPNNAPPSERAVTAGDTTDQPVFGVSLESTSEAGAGPAVQVGNTLQVPTGPAKDIKKIKPLPVPVAADEVTTMPTMGGRCQGEYTAEAKENGIEGVVIMDVLIDEDGNVADIHLVTKIGHGLDESAVKALKACKWKAGQKGGRKVAVRVRGVKMRFILNDDAE